MKLTDLDEVALQNELDSLNKKTKEVHDEFLRRKHMKDQELIDKYNEAVKIINGLIDRLEKITDELDYYDGTDYGKFAFITLEDVIEGRENNIPF